MKKTAEVSMVAGSQVPCRPTPAPDPLRIERFVAGLEPRAHELFGAHAEVQPTPAGAVAGTRFTVWAPNAQTVSVIGDMNAWQPDATPLQRLWPHGVWTGFVAGVGAGTRYKYRVVGADGVVREKADPCARAAELRPRSASVVAPLESSSIWSDAGWLREREARQHDGAPISIYEVHLGSWRRDDGRWLGYAELATTLVPWAAEMGFTHLELLPVLEHPLDASWGYQPLGFFAPTSRFGSAAGLKHLIDTAHAAGLGVILDWVPGHFPSDGHGLARFDGTPLYELDGPNGGPHPDWGTLAFDFSSPPVRSFLISSALHWIEDYHIDGLRVDAVASMLYLDYSRKDGEWAPNVFGGRENLDAVAFLRQFNDVVHRECPGVLTIAEESTAWPGVSHGLDRGGLGFDHKWNMGWMNDTLDAMSLPPERRPAAYHQFTFSLLYAFSERFVLPLSHDEVVHGKGSLLGRMPGTLDERFAGLRALLALQWAHPGKKLLFMGSEFAQWTEWSHDHELDWALLDFDRHQGARLLVGDLNRLYRTRPALHALDFRPEGFEWLDCHDDARVLLSFLRWAPGWTDPVIVVAHLLLVVQRTPVRIPVPWPGHYRVRINTDAPEYGGTANPPLPATFEARRGRVSGRDWHIELPLPALAVVLLEPVGTPDHSASVPPPKAQSSGDGVPNPSPRSAGP
jgi:1,4-alpha-glucan branching enzyme